MITIKRDYYTAIACAISKIPYYLIDESSFNEINDGIFNCIVKDNQLVVLEK